MDPDRLTCPQCGAFNDPTATRCLICGAPLSAPPPQAGAPGTLPSFPAAVPPALTPPVAGAPPATPVRRGGRTGLLIVGLLGLCVVALLASGLFVLAGGGGA